MVQNVFSVCHVLCFVAVTLVLAQRFLINYSLQYFRFSASVKQADEARVFCQIKLAGYCISTEACESPTHSGS